MQYNRPYPYVNTGTISPNPRPYNPSPIETYTPYAFEVDPNGYMENPWDYDSSPATAHPSYYGNGDGLDIPPRPRSRTHSVFEQPTEFVTFPEPQIYRSSSQRVTSHHAPLHRNSRSDTGLLMPEDASNFSPSRGASPASFYFPDNEV